MGSTQSKDKMYCTRYLNGQGPPTLKEQVNGKVSHPNIAVGTQPDGGQMKLTRGRRSLEGYHDYDTIQIIFDFEDGIQTEIHPRPGQMYHGLHTSAYLPQNNDGIKVYKLLETAFQLRLLFTVLTNSKGEEEVMFTDIPLKTSVTGGVEGNGYPDPNYLKKVMKIMKSKGVN